MIGPLWEILEVKYKDLGNNQVVVTWIDWSCVSYVEVPNPEYSAETDPENIKLADPTYLVPFTIREETHIEAQNRVYTLSALESVPDNIKLTWVKEQLGVDKVQEMENWSTTQATAFEATL